ncbi:CARDB domain-containing protein [Halobaculum marinum]|uniref:CARDB domain-containing protein n=1 Tax=Halobaculum marinum TaxID=3031996 RepID=A0ABD5WX97_9EURY|nr:CARDB domain-containing protein [Halobaculum sp. DT55]
MGARKNVLWGLVVLFTAALIVGPAVGAAGAQSSSCAANGAQQVCLVDAGVDADTIVTGQSTELSVTVENVGDERATAVVVLNVASPDNETDSYELRTRSLAPGETLTVTQSIDATTIGTHALQTIVYSDGYGHRYDATEPMTVTVEPRGLGGPIDAPEYALGALVGSLGVAGAIVYRRR